ncbi:MAG: secretin N-terminal domain-containing protein [Phycisphaerae bacterium]|jgi:type II secretory pathway component GspD/PulD (secretin)
MNREIVLRAILLLGLALAMGPVLTTDLSASQATAPDVAAPSLAPDPEPEEGEEQADPPPDDDVPPDDESEDESDDDADKPKTPITKPGGPNKPRLSPASQKNLEKLLERAGTRRPQQDPKTTPTVPERYRRATRPNPTAGRGNNQDPRTPTRRPTGSRPGRTPDRGTDMPPDVTGRGESGDTTTLDVEPTLSEITPEDKIYSFSIADGSYEQLVTAFARQTGLGVIGAAPKDGKVNFVTDEELAYEAAFSRVRMLLRHYKPHDPYYLIRHEKHLEVVRVNDYLRKLPPTRMYRTLEDFRAAGLPDDELVLVIYTPKSGSVADLRIVRDFMPDYLRVTPIEDRNAVTIYAFVDDIEKYFEFKRIFVGGSNDPRTLEIIPVEHIAPSEALATLSEMMDIDGGGARTRSTASRRGGGKDQSRLDNMLEPEVGLWPNDTRGYLLVRAMQDKIQEIKMLLPYIDVPQPEGEPVVIPLQHADPGELIEIIEDILVASSSEDGATPSTRARPSRRRRGAKDQTPTTSATAGGLTMIAHPSADAIIAIGEKEDIDEIRKYVTQFDQPSAPPIEIVLNHASAIELATFIPTVTSDPERGKGPADFQLVPDANDDSRMWYAGSNAKYNQVMNWVKQLDVPHAEVELRVVELTYQLPSFVASILREYEQESAPQATPTPSPKPKTRTSRRRRTRPMTASKFTPDDDAGRLYVLCSNEQWEEYKPIIDSLEEVGSEEPLFVRLSLQHITPDEAVELLPAFFEIAGQDWNVGFMPSEEAVLVTGASPTQLEQIKDVIAEIDRPVNIEERTFDIRYADPGDIKTLIETLVADGDAGRPSRRRSSKAAQAAAAASPTISPDLTIVELGTRLIVRATPEKMERVAALIEQFDVEDSRTELKVYKDFPSGADIEDIAETLKSLMATAAPRSRSSKGRAKSAAGEAPRFIAQPGIGQLLVIAPSEDFDQIDEYIAVLSIGSTPEPVFTEFIEVKFADPDELVEQITPLLNMKVRELAVGGELDPALDPSATPGTSSKTRARRPGDRPERFHILADPRSSRVVISAEQLIIDEAKTLIAQFDLPGDDQEVVVQLVELKHATAPDVVKAVKEMRGAPTRPTTRRAKGKASAGSADEYTALTIAEAPGGQAVVLRGERPEVDEVVGWIERLDARATSGRALRVFEIANADLIRLGELIIHTVDTPIVRPGAKPSTRRGRRAEPEEEDEFASTKTWDGDQLYMQADLISRTLLVSTTPAKMAEIEDTISRFDSEDELGVTSAPVIPSFTYELRYTDAFDAVFNAEMAIEQLWSYPGELPKVEEAFWGDYLVVKYPYEERFDEIRAIIREYVDKPDPDQMKKIRKTVRVPKKLTAKELAYLLQATHPELDIQIKNLREGPTEEYGLTRLIPEPTTREAVPPQPTPCVLPTGFTRMVDALAVTVTAQDPPDETAQDPAEETAHHAPEETDRELVDVATSLMDEEKVIIEYDDEEGVLYINGQASVVDEVPDWVTEIDEDLGDETTARPDIRVYRVRYIDVNTAADIINEMYNATRQQRQMMVQQQRLAAQRARQQARLQQQRARQQQPGRDDQEDQQPGRGRRGAQPTATPAAPQLPETAVRVYANERDRTLIFRADTSQYSALLELLATIDRPKPIDSEMRIFRLEKLNAAEVEEMLKDILGLDEQPRRVSRSRRTRRGAQPQATVSTTGPGSQLPETILQETKTGDLLGIDPEDISLHSNETANTIIAVAPRVALDYIENIIEQLETAEVHERVARYYELEHADADEVVGYLETHYGDEPTRPRGGRRGGRDASSSGATGILTAPTFIPFPRLNMITVLALEDDFEEIDDIIARLDVKDDRQWEHVVLKHADAGAVADTLTQMFTGKRSTPSRRGRPRRGTTTAGDETGPVFIGEEGSRMLIFTAPSNQRDLIDETIARLESEAEITDTVRVIPVLHAQASEVAEAIQTAYGGRGGSRGRRGGGQSGGTQFTITGDDPSKTLFVVADDTMFAEIESLVESLDKPREIGFEFRIYPLKYADARQVHTLMTKLIADYMRRMGRGANIEAFSVEVDDKANAIIALGGPAVFGFIEENLAKVDVPAYAKSPPGFLMIHLQNGDATEVAQNINRLWSGRNLAQGEIPPTAEANRSLNMLIVRGTQAQLDEIKSEVIDPLEAQEALKLQTETITLEFAEPEAVAESLNRIFEDKARAMKGLGRGANVPPLDYTVVVTPVTDTKQVVVQASETNMQMVRQRVAELDREDIAAISATAMKIYAIKYADPNAVVNIINQWARSRSQTKGRQAPRDVVTAFAEQGTQSVVVSASESNHMIIKDLLDGLDDETVATRQRGRHVLRLTHASAAEVANQFTQLFRQVTRRTRGDQGPAFVADAKTNSIVANVNDEELAEIEALLTEIDIESPLEAERVTEVYPLQYADPGSVNGVILNMFRWDVRSQPSPSQQVTSSPEWATQSVIVTAPAKTHAIIKAFIEKVDVESTLTKELHTYKLQHASADETARALQQVYRGQRPTRRGEQAVQITPDVASNSLLISATRDEMLELTVLIESLDVEPDLTGMQQVKSFHLNNADPYIAQEAITRLFRGGRSPRDQVAAIGDHETSSVVVSASPANLKRIEAFLEEFDSETSAEEQVHVVTLENADAESMSRTLTEVFIRSAARPRGGPQPISISAVGGSKALLVKCNEQDFADIDAAIKELDSEAAAGAEEVRVVTLLYGDATEMQRAMEQALQKPSGRGKELVGNIKLAPLASSNAMLVSGSLERVNDLEEQIHKLDEAAKDQTEPQLIPLKHVTAGQILPTLQEAIVEAKGRTMKGQRTPVITADESQKNLIVSAGRADLSAIQSLVEKLDTEEAAGGTNFRIVQLAPGVNVTEMAETVESVINNGASARATSGKGRRDVPSITVTPDRRTISLVFAGSPELFDDAEKLAREMEEMGPMSGRSMAVITIDTVPADELTSLIERLRGEGASSTTRKSSSSSRRRPASSGRGRRP